MRGVYAAGLTAAACLFFSGALAVFDIAIIGFPRPQPAAPRPRPIIVAGDRYPDRRDLAEAAESAKIERELAAIRSSLDHVTVHVHVAGEPQP